LLPTGGVYFQVNESAGGEIAEKGSGKPTGELTDRGVMSDEEQDGNRIGLFLNPLEKGAGVCAVEGRFYFYTGCGKLEVF
jgi:hypothetical protein